MTIVYNSQLKGWQILYKNKPINDKVYESWDSAMHYLDKCGE